MANPLVPLGLLNRLVATVNWASFPSLNVTAAFLNRGGIVLALDGQATKILQAMAGTVLSPEPYQAVTLSINLLKTQSLSNQYKTQMELSTVLGTCTVRPDVSSGLGPYQLFNMAIESVREQSYAGEDAGWTVMCAGYYTINSSLWVT